MAKLGRPLQGEIWVTQTYHTGSNNTAVDFSANADAPVLAVADGVVTYRSTGAGSYCIQTLDNSDLKVYYVHTYKWVGANTRVKKGQVIAYIAPTSLNGGYPTHLHLGLQTGKYLMNYMDRSIVFRTRFQDIKNIWFSGENLNWAKFSDLSYQNTTMSNFKIGDRIEFTGEQNIRKGSGTSFTITGSTKVGQVFTIEDGPRVADGYTWYDLSGADWVADVGKFKIYVAPVKPPEAPGQTECEKEVERLKGEINGLREDYRALQGTVGGMTEERKGLVAEIEQFKIDYKELQNKYDVLHVERNRLENEKNEAIRQLKESNNLAGASAGDMFAELFRRLKNALDKSA